MSVAASSPEGVSAKASAAATPKLGRGWVVRPGVLEMLAGSVCFVARLDPEAGAEIVAIPDTESAEVGGLRPTVRAGAAARRSPGPPSYGVAAAARPRII